MDDIYNDRGHYIGPKDVLEDGARWYDDQDQSRGDLRCLECMYKCDLRNPRLFVDMEMMMIDKKMMLLLLDPMHLNMVLILK